MKGLLGKKVGMTQVFAEDGTLVPVTVIEVEPSVIVQMKTVETDGYNAIQVGHGQVKEKHLNKPLKGHFEKAGVSIKKHLQEFRLDTVDGYEIGQEIAADLFETGAKVDVVGVSKGKGFQGVIKRHNQSRGPMSHGSHYHRRPGSMGNASSAGRVFKGKKLPGHMGHVRVTVQNLEVVRVDTENKMLLLKGAVPGAKGGLLTIKESVKLSK